MDKDQIIDDAYKNYCNAFVKELMDRYDSSMGVLNYKTRPLSKEDFIKKCKTDTEFSERWGLKIEERELSDEERVILLKELEIFQERVIDNAKSEMIHSLADSHSIPTKLITITYNNEKIEIIL